MNNLPDGLLIVVKQDCPTCVLIEPVLQDLQQRNIPLTVLSQDNPAFPENIPEVVDDTSLEWSYRLNIETVPTVIQIKQGRELERTVGWNRSTWESFTGCDHLGQGLPDWQPGCGSKSVEPGIAETLEIRFGESKLQARRVELAALEDEIEATYARGWSDGLPVVPPTEARVMRMLSGTSRQPDEVIGVIPPNNIPCTVEKAAINAVMAGCKPEYLPVVLTAIEAACLDAFCMHGVLATTYFVGPVIIVNGSIATTIGMNSGVNVLGQGNRANATIGRALQLTIRNIGGGVPGGVDRATLGNPGKYTFCFAEREAGTSWQALAVEQGFSATASTVSLFAGSGVQPIVDQISRTPDSLARSFAASLRTVTHSKLVSTDAVLVVSPEHSRVFETAGWDKERLRQALLGLLQIPATELVRGASDIAEGLPERVIAGRETIPKFKPNGLHIVRAGGTAGLFSAIIAGWTASGERGSQLVTKEIL